MMRRPRRHLPAALLAATVIALPLAGCSGTEVPVTEATTVIPGPEDETPSPDEPSTPSTSSPSEPSPSETVATGETELEEGSVSQQLLGDVVGQDVIFTAEVVEIVQPGTLTVGGQQDGQEPALVVGAELPPDVEAGDAVQVRGTVRDFDLVAVEQEVGTDLDDATFAAYDGQPYVLAATALR